MTPKINSGELCERFVAIDLLRCRDTLVQKRVGELFTYSRATANNAAQLRANEYVCQSDGVVRRNP
jgi:hypothetical protein